MAACAVHARSVPGKAQSMSRQGPHDECAVTSVCHDIESYLGTRSSYFQQLRRGGLLARGGGGTRGCTGLSF